MGIVNRRNAVIGWAVLKAGKRMAKRRARNAVPGDSPGRLRTAVVAVAAAAVGLLAFRRSRKSS